MSPQSEHRVIPDGQLDEQPPHPGPEPEQHHAAGQDALPTQHTRTALTEYSEGERDRAYAAFRSIQPHIEQDVPLSRLVGPGASLRTLKRRVANYRQSGLARLVRCARPERGQRRIPQEEVLLIEGLALQRPKPKTHALHNLVTRIAKTKGWSIPSYRTMCEIVAAIDPALSLLAHEGAAAYAQHEELVHRHEVSRPNERWQADHAKLPLWVLDERGKPTKCWLTVIEDEYSRAIAGFALSYCAPNALHTALALHQAIWRKSDSRWHVCGIPATFYTDNGPDFRSKHMEQVAADLHMHLIFGRPGHPRGKGKMERFMGTVKRELMPELPGYTPPMIRRGSRHRGKRRGRQAPARQRRMQVPSRQVPLLTLPQLEARLRDWILGTYHTRAHRTTRHRPIERWEAGGFLPNMPETREQLDLLLLTLKQPRVVHSDGIYFGGYRYYDPTLAAYQHEPVEIRYDPRDPAVVRVYRRGYYICSAICPELAGQTVALKDITAANRARRKELRARLADRKRVVRAGLALMRGQVPPSSIPVDPPERAAVDGPTDPADSAVGAGTQKPARSTQSPQVTNADEDEVRYRTYFTE